MAQSDPISWRSIKYDTPVVSTDGQPLGRVREVLGSDSEDLFHGLRVGVAGRAGDVMLAADDIETMAAAEIRTSLSAREFAALGGYDETASYHLSSVGLLRKHLGWKQDGRSDEEPG